MPNGRRVRAGQCLGEAIFTLDARLAVLFPGQGSHLDEMGETVERELPELHRLARAHVCDDLFERAADGTRWAQPAIYCAALAAWEQLRGWVRADLMAGHSLGEIAALVAAGALTAEDGLRLVAERGRLMQEAAQTTGDGGMLAVRARDRSAFEAVVRACDVSVANENAPDQVVVSGRVDALEEAALRLDERGIRSKRLPVSGAFHSPLMKPAVEPFEDLIAEVEVREPQVPVLSCVTAEPFDDVRRRLVEALTAPVRWTDVLRALRSRGVTRFVETGPGHVLTGLVRKTLVGVDADALSEVANV